MFNIPTFKSSRAKAKDLAWINQYFALKYFRFTPALLALFLLFQGCQQHTSETATDPVDLVEPLVDAANSRWFFFNSATRPFGMVNLSPDNLLGGAWGSGYRYDTDTVRVFSHIHAWQLSGIPVMPITGAFDGSMGPDDYKSKFDHDKEEVKAGYHKVELDRYGIEVELTATRRVGFHRYTFPASDQSHVVIDFATDLGPSGVAGGYLKRESNHELSGYMVSQPTRRRPKPVNVYFSIAFDKPFETLTVWQEDGEQEIVDAIESDSMRAYVSFPTSAGETRLMKVGISYVSAEQARKNLEAELPHWDFDRVVDEARDEWNGMLSRIKVKGGTKEEQQRFYTDLWHALQGRRVVSDVDGKYLDFTGDERRIGQIPLDASGNPRFNHYNSDSFWGAQWTLNTLWHLVYPEISSEFVQSMLQMYQDGGLIPRGPSGGNYTYVMTGASTTPFIVSAYMKGIRDFDIDLAYEGMWKNHFPGGIMSKAGYEHATFLGGGIEAYIDRGYIPYPLYGEEVYGFHQDGAGMTLEYAYQDWTLAQMAEALGKPEDAALMLKRAENYKNLFDESTGWMRVRRPNGSWATPFDSLLYDNGWVEANAVQSTWFVPHDVAGLIDLMGGADPFVKKLNRSFEIASNYGFKSSTHGDRSEITEEEIPYLNYGNQPSMQVAYLFNYAGAPWLTQYWAREVIDAVYSGISPQKGYSGDEDQGLMGALAVLMKMGLFSMRGGAALEPVYELSSPIFDEIEITLDKKYYPGGSFVIRAENNSRENRYIQSATLDGQPLNAPWFLHSALVKGGELVLQMGPEPNRDWGSSVEAAPPSMSNEEQ